MHELGPRTALESTSATSFDYTFLRTLFPFLGSAGESVSTRSTIPKHEPDARRFTMPDNLISPPPQPGDPHLLREMHPPPPADAAQELISMGFADEDRSNPKPYTLHPNP